MSVDLHGLTREQARERLLYTMRSLPRDVRELTVIHGYRGGTALRDMVRRFSHPKIERKILGLNQGETIFIIKKQ